MKRHARKEPAMLDKTEKSTIDVVELSDEALEEIAGGNPGGKPGRCPGCGSKSFTDLGGGKIRCNDCGWEGAKSSIGL